MSYFLAFLGFALLILLHEGGHFLAAKAVGMRVERFSLFFGPMFVKRTVGETEYGIGLIPLGGYVKITGMSPNEIFEEPSHEARAYINQPPWKRVVVIAAGPAVNLILAFLLAWLYFLGTKTHDVINPQGQYVPTNAVGAITVGSAAQGQFKLGDKLVSVDGVRGGPQTVHAEVAKHTCAGAVRIDNCRAATPVTVVVRRNGVLKTLHVRPRWSSAYGEMLLGITFANKTAPNGFFYSAGQSVAGMWRVTKATASVLAQIFKPAERKQLHSIVGGLVITSQAISAGWTTGVERLALISLALGLINLLPLLPFDGGHIFWAVAEKLRGRKIPYKVMERATIAGFAVVALLLVIGVSNDITTLAGAGFHAQ